MSAGASTRTHVALTTRANCALARGRARATGREASAARWEICDGARSDTGATMTTRGAAAAGSAVTATAAQANVTTASSVRSQQWKRVVMRALWPRSRAAASTVEIADRN